MEEQDQILKLDGERIYQAFLSGAYEVIKEKIELNRINVFPIADGDTGSNLAFTMRSIIENAQSMDSPKKTLASIADAALMGARGNSGIIFAQFVNGVFMEISDNESVGVTDFAQTIKKASTYAYKAISNPVEGTMITVIEDWADSLINEKDKAKNFLDLISQSLSAAWKSLNETPEKLQALKDANVVDSGAKGFVHFIEGMLHYLETGEIENLSKQVESFKPNELVMNVHENFDENYRYCVEGIIQSEDEALNLEQIKAELGQMGDSLIIAGNQSKIRLHIHSNNPEELFFKLKDYGKIVFQKADDMKRQYESIYDRKNKVAILTDSIADLPQEFMDQHQVHLLPLNILIEDSNYLDKVTITAQYFYKLMDRLDTYPSSAQPTKREAEKILLELASHYDSIIVITVSSKMSGTYETILRASKHEDLANTDIKVIDSKLNSGAEGLVVKKAAEALAAGHDFKETVKIIEDTIKKTHIFVSVPTLKYMLRSGRIGRAQAFAANIVNLKPVVSIDEAGDGIVIGKTFSQKGNTKKIQELVKEIMKNHRITNYAIVHANGGQRVKEFEEYYTQLIGKAPDYTMEISAIVAMSAGIGAVAIALTTE
ncbi:DAK2 domain-containing protein [Facklamia sp. 7083-14-GEN3]|uniref:DAK2 domain-containing protein n=1 Tax=Facklamia sp. 7083-14-GEN3 TaxID=2973478 RepID=UPI00215B9FA3|nr:DegV family protein [Facklamia sp. 7083-14-GEN3]MCR8969389.1 DegV family EDD domain-containing protein [Facklamia sp. 7083-14-GEN3]